MAADRKDVLVVDDDPALVGMVELLLDSEGYQVTTAEEGQQALDGIARKMPHLILLDMLMPGMDGWEFAREFHAKYDHRVPIVVLTAAENARQRAQEIDAEGYLGKPFEIDDLVKVVQKYLAREL
jgi:CheY-like chemotaxis protein